MGGVGARSPPGPPGGGVGAGPAGAQGSPARPVAHGHLERPWATARGVGSLCVPLNHRRRPPLGRRKLRIVIVHVVELTPPEDEFITQVGRRSSPIDVGRERSRCRHVGHRKPWAGVTSRGYRDILPSTVRPRNIRAVRTLHSLGRGSRTPRALARCRRYRRSRTGPTSIGLGTARRCGWRGADGNGALGTVRPESWRRSRIADTRDPSLWHRSESCPDGRSAPMPRQEVPVTFFRAGAIAIVVPIT